jgi:RNA polymerase sigma factor (TIGR02999 family)
MSIVQYGSHTCVGRVAGGGVIEFPQFERFVLLSPSDTITRLMSAFRGGDREAGGALAKMFYPELRRLAAAKMKGERVEHTLQPTALVHELYLELVKVRAFGTSGSNAEEERAAFLRLAGHIMKRMLVHHARPLYRKAERVALGAEALPAATGAQSLQDVEDALSRLAAIEPRLRKVVEMKVFEGMTSEEIARRLGCSRSTVSSCWSFAQSWLREQWAGSHQP